MRFLKLFSLTLLFCCALLAQTAQRKVTLTWLDAINPAGTTYNVYRAPGDCTGSPTFTKLNTEAFTPKTYDDLGPPEGTYCYVVRAFRDTLESGNSNTASVAVGPPPTTPANPTGLAITVSVVVTVTQPAVP